MQDDAPDGCLGILHQAAEIVAQRRQQYGPPAEHFEQVAQRWSFTIGTAVRPEVVLLCQLDLKLARLAHDPGHRDSLVDLIGYSVLLHELVSDASAEGPAEVAELAEPEGCGELAAAEVLLKSAEAKRGAG
jgi:Domain of unknown function (DUF6378)